MHTSIQIFSRLINHPDIDVNALTDFSETPLHIASKVNKVENCELLINAGVCVDKRDDDLNTALHYAAEMGYKELVELLLKHHASPDVKNSNCLTPA
jgi:ankyrin repeat protein